MPEKRTDCPFCHKEKHLYVNVEKGVWHCVRCGRGGKLSPGGKILSEVRGDSSVNPSQKKPLNSSDLGPIEHIQEGDLYWEYARRRNAIKYRKSLFKSKKWPEFLIIGLPLSSNNPTFFFGRRVILAGKRYHYFNNTRGIICKSFKEGKKVKSAIVVEGFFDLCKTSEYKPTMALLGKGWDEDKVKRISECVEELVYICLDRDALLDSCRLLNAFPSRLSVRILFTDVFKDPGEESNWIVRKIGGLDDID